MSRNKANNDLSWIWAAPDRHVRAILLSVCDDDYVRQLAQDRRRQFEQSSDKTPSFCVQCDTVFDEDDNDSKACAYHPGGTHPLFVFVA